MKTTRIVLTASILLSLKSTLFCSSEKATKASNPLTRNNSFDALRDGGISNGWLGWTPDDLANFTIDNCGNDYKGQEVRIGSKNTAVTAWTTFGEKIDNVNQAQQFLATLEKSVVTLPEQATAKSHELISAKIEAGKNSFKEHNQASKFLLKELFAKKISSRPNEKKAIQEKYEAMKKAELTEMYKRHQQEDAQTSLELQENLKRLVAIKATHNQEFSEIKDQIVKMIFAKSEQDLSGKKLAATASKYKYWTPQSADSYASAVEGDK